MTESETSPAIGTYRHWKSRFLESFKGNSRAEYAAERQAINVALHKKTLAQIENWPEVQGEIVDYFIQNAPEAFSSWVNDSKLTIDLGFEDERVKQVYNTAAKVLGIRRNK